MVEVARASLRVAEPHLWIIQSHLGLLQTHLGFDRSQKFVIRIVFRDVWMANRYARMKNGRTRIEKLIGLDAKEIPCDAASFYSM